MAYHQPQESLVSSTQDRTSSWLKAVDESRSVSDASDRDSLINSHGSDKSVLTLDDHEHNHSFPWLASFSQKCADLIDKKFDLPVLHNLISEFVKSLTADVNECYKKPNRAAKLKKVVNEYLCFFHMIYLDIKEPLEHLPYLNRMSDLLAMYVDLEIKASRRRKEHAKIICGKLTAALFVFLRYSMDHILDTMLKTRLMAKSSMEISAPVLGRVLRDKPLQPICEMTYVRYILVYKLWKKVVRGADERRRINKQASTLVPPPDDFRKMARCTMLDGILPSIPKSRTDITQFFMQAKFSVKEKAKAFLKISQDPNRSGVVLVPNFTPDIDKSLFYDDFMETSSRFDCSPIREESSRSLLDDVLSTMSDSSSTHDLISSDMFGSPKNKLTQDLLKKKKVNDNTLSKKLTKKKLKNKESKLDLCDSTKKNKNKDSNKIGKIPSSPLNKPNKKVKKEVPVELLSKLNISNSIDDKLSRSASPVNDENVDIVKKFGQTKLIESKINEENTTTNTVENNKSSIVDITEGDDDDDDDDEEDDDEDDDKSSVSAVKEETQGPDEKETEQTETENVNLSFSNRILPEKDKEPDKDKAIKETCDVTVNNEVTVVGEETQHSDTVQCTAISSDDNNMLIDKSEDTNDNEVSFRGFPSPIPTSKDVPATPSVELSDQEEPKVDIPSIEAEPEATMFNSEPPAISNEANSFTMNENSNSSDCIIESVIPAPINSRTQRLQLENTSVVKTEDVNFELAGILDQDSYTVYPVQPIEEQNEIGGEEFLTGLMQQWSSQDEIYTYHPSYDLDVVETCHNIITVSSGEEDIISGNGDAFFGTICNGVMVSDDRDGDSVSTRMSYESASNIRDGKITYRGKTQPTMDCSSERSSSDVNVQTCMSDSEPQTPASCESENSPDVSLNTNDITYTSPSPNSSPAGMKSVETSTSTFSPFVQLLRTDVSDRQLASRLTSPEPVCSNSSKKNIKRKVVSFRESDQPPNKQLHREEGTARTISCTDMNIVNYTSSNSREKSSNSSSYGSSSSSVKRRDNEDSVIRSVNVAVNRNDSNNNNSSSSGGRSSGSSSGSSSGIRESRDSKDSHSSTSTTSRGKSSARRTRKSSDLLDQRPLIERAREREKEKELLENEIEKEPVEDKKRDRSRSTKHSRQESAASSSTSSSHQSSSNSSRSSKQSQSQSQKRKKRGTGNQRISWEETAYNPPKTRQSTLKEKGDAAQLDGNSSNDQPRRSPKKNML